jgi:hypothetical protein
MLSWVINVTRRETESAGQCAMVSSSELLMEMCMSGKSDLLCDLHEDLSDMGRSVEIAFREAGMACARP